MVSASCTRLNEPNHIRGETYTSLRVMGLGLMFLVVKLLIVKILATTFF